MAGASRSVPVCASEPVALESTGADGSEPPAPSVGAPLEVGATVDVGSTVEVGAGVVVHGVGVVPVLAPSDHATLSSDWPLRPRVAWGVARRSSSLGTVVDRSAPENARPPRSTGGTEQPY